MFLSSFRNPSPRSAVPRQRMLSNVWIIPLSCRNASRQQLALCDLPLQLKLPISTLAMLLAIFLVIEVVFVLAGLLCLLQSCVQVTCPVCNMSLVKTFRVPPSTLLPVNISPSCGMCCSLSTQKEFIVDLLFKRSQEVARPSVQLPSKSVAPVKDEENSMGHLPGYTGFIPSRAVQTLRLVSQCRFYFCLPVSIGLYLWSRNECIE